MNNQNKTSHTTSDLLPEGYSLTSTQRGIEVVSETGWRGYKGFYLDQRPDADGYLYVRVTVNGKRQKRYMHRLVCRARNGAAPAGLSQARHLDGNRQNNKPFNLAWGTEQENANDREAHGNTSRGLAHSQAIKLGFAAAGGAS